MKTTNDLKSDIERHAQNIREAQAAISKLYATRPYTAKEAKEVKRLKGQISREENHIADRRQDIVYLECTPPPEESRRASSGSRLNWMLSRVKRMVLRIKPSRRSFARTADIRSSWSSINDCLT